MRKKTFLVVLLVSVLILMLAVTGCGKKAEPPKEPPKQVEKFDKEKPGTLVIGSASVGGTYYLYANGWAALATQALGIPVTVEVTDGPNHNLILIQDKEILLGMATMGPAYEAWEGLESWTGGIEHKNVRSLFPMYNTYFHWIADANKGINSLRDMEGKNVGSGPAAGTIGTFGPRIFELLGIKAKISHGGIGDLMENQGDGLLDANGFAAGIPVSAYTQYEATKGADKVVFIGVSGADREKIKAEWPYLSNAVVPAATYAALKQDLETIGVWNIAIASKYLDDEFVYKMVKAVLENNEVMTKQGHPAAKETLIENFKYMDIIPLHPGAIKYYKEKGYQIPDNLIPPEYAE